MAAIRRNMITVEMQDGSLLGPERIIFADKMRLERSAKANQWDISRDEIRVQSFLSWSALNRVKATELGYEAFLEQVVDIDWSNEAPAGEDGEDPTLADTSA